MRHEDGTVKESEVKPYRKEWDEARRAYDDVAVTLPIHAKREADASDSLKKAKRHYAWCVKELDRVVCDHLSDTVRAAVERAADAQLLWYQYARLAGEEMRRAEPEGDGPSEPITRTAPFAYQHHKNDRGVVDILGSRGFLAENWAPVRVTEFHPATPTVGDLKVFARKIAATGLGSDPADPK